MTVIHPNMEVWAFYFTKDQVLDTASLVKPVPDKDGHDTLRQARSVDVTDAFADGGLDASVGATLARLVSRHLASAAAELG